MGEVLGKKTITIQAYEKQRIKLNIETLFTVVRKLNISRDIMGLSILYDVFLECNDFGDYPEYINEFLDELYPFDENSQQIENNDVFLKEKLKLYFSNFLKENLKLYIKSISELEKVKVNTKKEETIIKNIIDYSNKIIEKNFKL